MAKIMSKLLRHDIPADIQFDNYIVPLDIDRGNTVYISTIWSRDANKGQTTRTIIPKRSYWKIQMEKIKEHTSIQEAMAFHDEIVKKTREERDNGRSVSSTCVNA
jgi:hypothetical protein